MMSNHSKILSIILFIFSVFPILISCGNDSRKFAEGKYDVINKGELFVYSDEVSSKLMSPVYGMYDSAYKDIKFNYKDTNARAAMAFLLAGDAEAIVTSRDYLRDEDSLMRKFRVDKHKRMNFADDGLVFFTSSTNLLLDTLNTQQINDIFLKGTPINELLSYLKTDYSFAITDNNSSIYANFQQIVLKGNQPSKKLQIFDNCDKLIEFIVYNSNTIGIGYLSQVVGNDKLKMIKIGYNDSSGKRIYPRTVHQANIVRGLYPYVVHHYVYLLEDRQNIPFWFGQFLSKETKVQQYFLNSGLVPTFARIKLTFEE